VHEIGGGHYYFNARWYDSSTGRFTTEDPIRDGVNWYAYVASNPLILVDPNGLEILHATGLTPPGDQPWRYFIGNEIHRAIGRDYSQQVFPDQVFVDQQIGSVYRQITRSEPSPHSDLNKRPDIVNAGGYPLSPTRELPEYEIKPISDIEGARSQRDRDIRAMNDIGLNAVPGPSAGVQGVVATPNGVAAYFSPEEGVILYRNFQGATVDTDDQTAVEELIGIARDSYDRGQRPRGLFANRNVLLVADTMRYSDAVLRFGDLAPTPIMGDYGSDVLRLSTIDPVMGTSSYDWYDVNVLMATEAAIQTLAPVPAATAPVGVMK
jgi:hypothetical protein